MQKEGQCKQLLVEHLQYSSRTHRETAAQSWQMQSTAHSNDDKPPTNVSSRLCVSALCPFNMVV